NLIFLKNLSKNISAKKLYKSYYNNEIMGRFKLGVELIVKLFRFFRAFKIFTISSNAKSILDIGSGRGFMLYFLKKYYKYQVAIGTQLNKKAINFSRSKLGLQIYNADLLKIPLQKSYFDVVTIWHVLEHIRKPELYLRKIHQLLKSGGKLIIEVPNFNSWTRSLTGKYWMGLDLKYHVNFFVADSLIKILKKNHFKINNIHTFSLEYSTFLSVQSLVSFLTKTNHLFFSWLQNKTKKTNLIFHVFLFIILAPPCFVINFMLQKSKKGEVLLIVASKK
ncbi:class I SAM-dependent methyltransferase, partial [Patescibacteria group bacterium]